MNSIRNYSRTVWFALSVVVFGCLLLVASHMLVSAQSSIPPESGTAPSSTSTNGGLSLSIIFTAFMVMLGPVKIVFPFATLTSGMEEAAARKIGLKAIGIACVGGLVAAITGQNTLVSWQISLSALHLAAGIVLLLVALKNMLEQYAPVQEAPKPATVPPNLAFTPLAFPVILTPHGLATFILILAVTRDTARDITIFALFLIVMALNLVAMWYARAIVRRGGGFLIILGSVLGVLQVALAVQIILDALNSLHVLPKL